MRQGSEGGQRVFEVLNATIVQRVELDLSHKTEHTERPIPTGEEVHRQCRVACFSETSGDLAYIVVQTKDLMNNDDARKRPCSFG